MEPAPFVLALSLCHTQTYLGGSVSGRFEVNVCLTEEHFNMLFTAYFSLFPSAYCCLRLSERKRRVDAMKKE